MCSRTSLILEVIGTHQSDLNLLRGISFDETLWMDGWIDR